MIFCLFVSNRTKIFLKKNIGNNKSNDASYLIRKGEFTFNLSKYKTFYNHNFNLQKISYLIQVFDSNNTLILPSDLTLYYNFHIICFLNINKINITSLAGIENDKYFKCTEFFSLNESIEIGFFIYKTKTKKERILVNISHFTHQNLYNYKHNKNVIFDIPKNDCPSTSFSSKYENTNNNIDTNKLKKLYVSKPIFELKRNFENRNNYWIFANLFNEYFCFCKGSKCLNNDISQACKYYFYLHLLDYNHHIYEKTDFLLFDFILKKYTSADVYPVFEKMINRNISAHYLTERKDLYEKYCHNNKYCDLIIFPENNSLKINGDFLEKHFTLILKLRQVLSSVGVNINFINNLFYNIDYITYICIGHGVSFFKYYLYDEYYGPQNFDKLLIPNSEKLIRVPIKHGWKEENIIKFNLPRWEKYNFFNESINSIGKIRNNSIFIMFTWREIKKRRKISKYYIRNIFDLINNKQIINNLQMHNLSLYFSLHHKFHKYKKQFKIMKNIKYIHENDISECLSKTQLVITDYSSIIFDMIYRRKPYILFIPDANDSKIKQNYKKFCYGIIKNFCNNKFNFENVFFDVKSTVNKIKYYIDNDFKLEMKLKNFYDEFNFHNGSFINDFIDNLLKL